MTDIKIDTFANEKMQNTRLSFQTNTAGGDSVYFQFIIFTKEEKDKWGSQEVIGFKSAAWKIVKVKLSSLHWDNWGKGTIATPDFNAIVPARIEIGVRSAHTIEKGKIDVRIDDILFTNY